MKNSRTRSVLQQLIPGPGAGLASRRPAALLLAAPLSSSQAFSSASSSSSSCRRPQPSRPWVCACGRPAAPCPPVPLAAASRASASGGSPTVAAAPGGSDALTDRCSAPPSLPPGHVGRGRAGRGGGDGGGRGDAEGSGPAEGAAREEPGSGLGSALRRLPLGASRHGGGRWVTAGSSAVASPPAATPLGFSKRPARRPQEQRLQPSPGTTARSSPGTRSWVLGNARSAPSHHGAISC